MKTATNKKETTTKSKATAKTTSKATTKTGVTKPKSDAASGLTELFEDGLKDKAGCALFIGPSSDEAASDASHAPRPRVAA